MSGRVTVVCVLLLSLIGLTLGCSGNQGAKAQEVTFAQLLTNPDQYNGRYVSLEGFYFGGFEVAVLSESV